MGRDDLRKCEKCHPWHLITLAEFCYRFNRCFALKVMLSRLGYAAVRTPPMPHASSAKPSHNS